MCSQNLRILVLFLLFLVSPQTLMARASAEQKRRFTSRDSVEMSYFGTAIEAEPDELDDDGIESPDGRYVVKITHRGVLPQGVTEATLWLFDARRVRKSINDPAAKPPEPIPLTRMSAAVNGLYAHFDDCGNTIFQVSWADDSRSLNFLGRNGRENRQLFRVDVATREIRALSPETQDVVRYSRSGPAFAYLASTDVQPERDWRSSGPGIPDMTIGTGTPLLPLLYPNFVGESLSNAAELQVWRVRNDSAAPVIDPRIHAPLRISTRWTSVTLSLSPDASKAVMIAAAIGVDAGDPADGPDQPKLRYQLIDLDHGSATPLTDSPIADYQYHDTGRYRAAWSPDAAQVAVSEINLPESDTGAVGGPKPCTVAIVDVMSHAVHCGIAHEAKSATLIHSIRWNAASRRVLARFKQFEAGAYTNRTIEERNGKWDVVNTSSDDSAQSLSLSVHQSLNEPPVLMATDTATRRVRVMLDPNPELAGVDFGTVSVYTWHDSQGRTIHGGLAKPPGWIPGKRYPLVIQTHGFNAKEFFRVGYGDTSNAGRALAGRDMMVLQVQEPGGPDSMTWQAGTKEGLDVYVSAIDQLAAGGLIDPKKVGITGFSYTGLLVTTAIVRAPDRFAAAAMADTDPGTLLGHSTYVDEGSISQDSANLVAGALPYGQGLKTWVERAPSLSSDKIRAPLLYTAADPWHLIAFWELYASLRDQGKPVELQYFRSGQHSITKPLQKWSHQEMLVDWFDFWLNGHEDSDSAKAPQYSRWRQLKKGQAVSEIAAVP